MSWEIDRVKHKSCPCQLGTYIIEYRSDDWGRSDESWVMICEDCKNNYTLVRSCENFKGIVETRYRWVQKQSKKGGI